MLQERDDRRIPTELNELIAFGLLLVVDFGLPFYSVQTSATAGVDNGCGGTLHLIR